MHGSAAGYHKTEHVVQGAAQHSTVQCQFMTGCTVTPWCYRHARHAQANLTDADACIIQHPSMQRACLPAVPPVASDRSCGGPHRSLDMLCCSMMQLRSLHILAAQQRTHKHVHMISTNPEESQPNPVQTLLSASMPLQGFPGALATTSQHNCQETVAVAAGSSVNCGICMRLLPQVLRCHKYHRYPVPAVSAATSTTQVGHPVPQQDKGTGA